MFEFAFTTTSIIIEWLELTFDSRLLRRRCESKVKARTDFGDQVAKKLWARLADMRAAESPKDLLAGRPIVFTQANRECMSVALSDGFRILFCANHNSVPLLKSGSVDWALVSRIKILQIERDHADSK